MARVALGLVLTIGCIAVVIAVMADDDPRTVPPSVPGDDIDAIPSRVVEPARPSSPADRRIPSDPYLEEITERHIVLRVVDAIDRPVARQRLRVSYHERSLGAQSGRFPPGALRGIRTDDQGRLLLFDPPRARSFVVEVHGPGTAGCVRLEQRHIGHPRTPPVRLFPSRRVRVKVVNEDGRGIPGTEVRVVGVAQQTQAYGWTGLSGTVVISVWATDEEAYFSGDVQVRVRGREGWVFSERVPWSEAGQLEVPIDGPDRAVRIEVGQRDDDVSFGTQIDWAEMSDVPGVGGRGERMVAARKFSIGPVRAGSTVLIHVRDPERVVTENTFVVPDSRVSTIKLDPGVRRAGMRVAFQHQDGSAAGSIPLYVDREYDGADVVLDSVDLPHHVVTDPDGSAFFRLHPLRPGALVVRREDVDPWPRSHGTSPARSVRIPFDGLIPGSTQSATAKLKTPPLLVSGRVVDTSGRPVPLAHVVLSTPGSTEPERNAAALQKLSAAKGTFAFFGHGVDAQRVRAVLPGRALSAAIPFETGQKDLTLMLRPLGNLVGRFKLRHQEFRPRLRVHVAPMKTEGPGVPTVPYDLIEGAPVDPSGRFRFASLHPGPWRLTVTLGPLALLEVPDIEVPFGVDHVDPRLDGVAVDGAYEVARIRVRSRDGRPIGGATVTVHAGSDAGGGLGPPRQGGRADGLGQLSLLVHGDARPTFRVRHRDYTTALASRKETVTEVVMSRRTLLRLLLDYGDVLPTSSRFPRHRVSLLPTTLTDRNGIAPETFDSYVHATQRRVEILVDPGEYHVEIAPARRGAPGNAVTTPTGATLRIGRVVVPEEGARARFDVDVAALKKLVDGR